MNAAYIKESVFNASGSIASLSPYQQIIELNVKASKFTHDQGLKDIAKRSPYYIFRVETKNDINRNLLLFKGAYVSSQSGFQFCIFSALGN